MKPNFQIIAEVKTASPFPSKLSESTDTWDELFVMAEKVWDILSIHTNPRWWWDFSLIKKARWLTDKPIMAKGIHETDEQIERAIELGADYVLVVGRIPEVHNEKVLYEVESLLQLQQFKKLLPNTAKIVWNSRHLSDGSDKIETFEQAKAIWPWWICQASNIKDISDVKSWADAVLVGTNLKTFIQSI